VIRVTQPTAVWTDVERKKKRAGLAVMSFVRVKKFIQSAQNLITSSIRFKVTAALHRFIYRQIATAVNSSITAKMIRA